MVPDPTRNRTAFAKTTAPAIAGAIRREALFSRLDGAGAGTLAWISGPAGSGKTTLAASYVETRAMRTAWYRVDRDDEDVATFLHYLEHAMRRLRRDRASAPAGKVLAPIPGGGAPVDPRGIARAFFRESFARLEERCALVIDNLHEVSADGPLMAALEAGLTQVPPGCCVILTSRNDPPPAFARLRADGRMTCIGWDELRMGSLEVQALARLRGHEIGEEACASLLERTQGWVAALVVFLEHARVSGGIARLEGESTPRLLFDYLAGEVFARFEAVTRAFLLRVAPLPKMTVPVAQQASGEPRAALLLANLALNDYFVREVVGEAARVYEIHPLMREFLLARAEVELPQAVDVDARRRCAGLLEAAGLVEDAIPMLIEIGDWAEVASLAAANAPLLIEQGRHRTLRRWLEAVPAATLEGDPGLQRLLGLASLPSSARQARHRFLQAARGFARRNEAEGEALSLLGAIDAAVSEFDDLGVVDSWIERLAELSQASVAAAAVLAQPQAQATMIRVGALRGSLPAHGPASAPLAPWACVLESLQGRFSVADEHLERLAPLAIHGSARISLALARALRHWIDGAWEGALAVAREGQGQAESSGVHSFDPWLGAIEAASLLGLGRIEEARDRFDAAEGVKGELRRGDRAILRALRTMLDFQEDDPVLAQRSAQLAVRLGEESGLAVVELLARLSLAQASLDRDLVQARTQIRAALAIAERLASPLLRASSLAVLAALELAQGAHEAAAGLAREFLGLVREGAFAHLPGVRPSLLADLCALALEREIDAQTARALVRSANLPPPARAARIRAWPWRFEMAFFGGFDLQRSSVAVEFAVKGAGRPVELLKVLVAMGGRRVRREAIADALWPQAEADFAIQSFNQTLHRLRRNILEQNDALLLRDGGLSLNPAVFWVDTWALEQVLEDLEALLRDPGADPTRWRAPLAAAYAIYRGPFLPDETDPVPCIGYREQVRARMLRVMGAVASRLAAAGDRQAAVDSLARLLERDPLFEGAHRRLMELHLQLGSHADGVAVYENLRSLLAARPRTFPSPETQALYAKLRRE
jgi:LuxR family maltose regulon positive regulatory protein